MDKLTRYRGAVKKCLLDWYEYLGRATPKYGSEVDCLIDDTRDNYMLAYSGWYENKRQRKDFIYLRIRDGKIWIENDESDDPVAEELLRLGVPMEDIVLAFCPPETRYESGFGVRGPFAAPEPVEREIVSPTAS